VRSQHPGDTKPVGEQGPSSAVPSTPNSRLGRKRSPIWQGWDRMDAINIGIDVSKDWLDVHILPCGEAFRVDNDGGGIDRLKARLCAVKPDRVALEATGGLETAAVAALAGAGLP